MSEMQKGGADIHAYVLGLCTFKKLLELNPFFYSISYGHTIWFKQQFIFTKWHKYFTIRSQKMQDTHFDNLFRKEMYTFILEERFPSNF